jgi:hypothetical protein
MPAIDGEFNRSTQHLLILPDEEVCVWRGTHGRGSRRSRGLRFGTAGGTVVGALIIVAVENYLAQLGSWVTVTQGVIFVICVLTFRRGVIGGLGRLIGRPL